MLLPLFVALAVVPLVEITLIVAISHAIGVLPTIVLLLLDAVIGTAVLRHQGRRAWAAARLAVRGGRVPGREVADGVLVLLGGVLLLAPGFLTDLLGLLCVLPPTRERIRRAALRRLTARLRLR